MDSAYLKQHVGKALALGLSEICQKKPADPIDYLSNWLRNHVKNLAEEAKEMEMQKQLEREMKEAEEEKRRQQLLLEEQEQIANEILKRDMENFDKKEEENNDKVKEVEVPADVFVKIQTENIPQETNDGEVQKITDEVNKLQSEVSSNDFSFKLNENDGPNDVLLPAISDDDNDAHGNSKEDLSATETNPSPTNELIVEKDQGENTEQDKEPHQKQTYMDSDVITAGQDNNKLSDDIETNQKERPTDTETRSEIETTETEAHNEVEENQTQAGEENKDTAEGTIQKDEQADVITDSLEAE